MPAGLIAEGVANAAGGILTGIAALKQLKEGKNILKNIGEETVPTEVLQNQIMAKNAAAEGLPAEQYNQAMRNIQRQQLMALRGARDRRGGLGILPSIQQGTNDATLNLDAIDANARRANEARLMSINNQVGDYKHNIWERKYNYGQSLRGAGNQNLFSGIDKLVGGAGLIGYGASGNNSNYNYGAGTLTPTGTYGYQGQLPQGIGNRRTPNFG